MKKLMALGSYVFAGGFTLGVRDHFEIAAHFEDGDYGVATASQLFPGLPIHTDPDRWPWERYHGRIALQYANPPCAAWSPLGPRAQRGVDAWERDPRVDCARTNFNLFELLEPTVYAHESVPQMYTAGNPFVRWLAARAVARGYHVYYVLHDAAFLGALQHRRRFFLVASRVAIDWRCDWLACPSVVDAFATLPANANPEMHDPTGYYTPAFLKMVPPGMALRAVYPAYLERVRRRRPNISEDDRKRIAPRPSFGERRMPTTKPSGAVVDSRIVHPTESRYLTLGEIAHLGGWPADIPLVGANTDARARLMTRAVLPPVGRWLGREVAAAVRRGKPVAPGETEVNLFKPPGTVRLITAG